MVRGFLRSLRANVAVFAVGAFMGAVLVAAVMTLVDVRSSTPAASIETDGFVATPPANDITFTTGDAIQAGQPFANVHTLSYRWSVEAYENAGYSVRCSAGEKAIGGGSTSLPRKRNSLGVGPSSTSTGDDLFTYLGPSSLSVYANAITNPFTLYAWVVCGDPSSKAGVAHAG